MNLQELLDSMDVFRQLTGLRLQDVYNLMLKKGWTLGSAQLMMGMHLVIRLFHRKQVRVLEAHWRESRPDLVVSLVPNFNRAIGESLRRAAPGTPLVTILTDHRRLSAAFLDRAAAAVLHLRIGPRGGAGARDGPRGRPHITGLRHDPQPALL